MSSAKRSCDDGGSSAAKRPRDKDEGEVEKKEEEEVICLDDDDDDDDCASAVGFDAYIQEEIFRLEFVPEIPASFFEKQRSIAELFGYLEEIDDYFPSALRVMWNELCTQPLRVTVSRGLVWAIIVGVASDKTDTSHFAAMILERLYVQCVCECVAFCFQY